MRGKIYFKNNILKEKDFLIKSKKNPLKKTNRVKSFYICTKVDDLPKNSKVLAQVQTH